MCRSLVFALLLAAPLHSAPAAAQSAASGFRLSLGPHLSSTVLDEDGAKVGFGGGVSYHWQPANIFALRPRLSLSRYQRTSALRSGRSTLRAVTYAGAELLALLTFPSGRVSPTVLLGPRLHARLFSIGELADSRIQKGNLGLVVGAGITVRKSGLGVPFFIEVRGNSDVSTTYEGGRGGYTGFEWAAELLVGVRL